MKEWWQNFFIPVTGEIMFSPRAKQSQTEVEQILKQVNLKKTAKILDLACGVGRHSIPFAKRNFEVAGLDFSKNFLAEARKSSRKEKVSIDFHHGDMKNLKPHFDSGEFDLVVSLYNSFGYFKTRGDDMKMLKEVLRVLKPGGRLVLNTLNGDGVKAALKKPVSMGREPIKNVFMIDTAKFDDSKRKTISEWTIIDARKRNAKVHRMSFQQNVYTFSEMKALLRNAGFKIEKTWGLLQGGPFTAKKSWHQTIVARKP